MILIRIFIFSPSIFLQLPIHSLASSVATQSRLRRTAASTWRQAITSHNSYSTDEEFLTSCQAELTLAAESDVLSHDDYAAFLGQYCQSDPGWACSYDTSYFWRLDPRLQRAFISDSCSGDAFHQEECLEYFAEHPEQPFGYSGEIEKLCSSVKELLVPTGLVREIASFSNEDSSFESETRSQELAQSQAHAVDEYSGKYWGSKRSGKRGKSNGNDFSNVDDEEDEELVNDKEKKGRDGNGKKDGDGENDNESIGGGQIEEDKEGQQSAANSSSNVAKETNGTITTGDQDVPASVDGSEGSLQVATSSNATVPSMGLNELNSNEPITEHPSDMNEELQNAQEGVSHNGHPQAVPPRSKAEENLGSSKYDENIVTSENEEDKVRNLVLAITGSCAFVLILGIAHGSRIRLHQGNKEASLRHYDCFAEDEKLSLPSSENGIFQLSDGSTLEAALSFIDSRTKKEHLPTTQQRARISSYFSRLIHLVKRDATAASDFDSVHARCEDLSVEAINDELPLGEEAVVDEKGWQKRLEIAGFSHKYKRTEMLGAGKTINRILRQIEESPCESEISAEESSISVYTKSTCDDLVNEERIERFKEFDDSLTTGLLKLTAQMSASRSQSKLVPNDSASNDASSFRSWRDCFETRAGNEFVYRGGAGSSGPDSSTASEIESTCSSITETMQAEAIE